MSETNSPRKPMPLGQNPVSDRNAALRDVLNDALRFADNVAHRAANEGEEDSDAIILGDRIRAALAGRSAG